MTLPTKIFLDVQPDPDILALFAEDVAPLPVTLIFNITSFSGFGDFGNKECSGLTYQCDNPEVLNYIEALAPNSTGSATKDLDYKFTKSTSAKKVHALIAERVEAKFPKIKIQAKIEGNLRSQNS